MEWNLIIDKDLESLPRIFQDLSLDMSVKAGKARRNGHDEKAECYDLASKKYKFASKQAKELDDFIKSEKQLLLMTIRGAKAYEEKGNKINEI